MAVDEWVVEDGRVILGEVRSVDRAGRRWRKQAKLTPEDCDKLAFAAVLATADEVLLATNAVALSRASVVALEGALVKVDGNGLVPAVRVMNGVDV